jgi:hypothetical protein
MSTTLTREQIAQRYLVALRTTQRITATEPLPFQLEFADGVLARNPYALRYLANGLNDVGKRVFSDVTGVALPRTQRGTWLALLAWGGVSAAADAAKSAHEAVERAHEVVRKRISNADDVLKWIESMVATGHRLVHDNGCWLFLNATTGKGFNLSKRGSQLSLLRPLIQAVTAAVEADQRVAAEARGLLPVDQAETTSPPLEGIEPLTA